MSAYCPCDLANSCYCNVSTQRNWDSRKWDREVLHYMKLSLISKTVGRPTVVYWSNIAGCRQLPWVKYVYPANILQLFCSLCIVVNKVWRDMVTPSTCVGQYHYLSSRRYMMTVVHISWRHRTPRQDSVISHEFMLLFIMATYILFNDTQNKYIATEQNRL